MADLVETLGYLALASLIFPLAVLMVALTGPHNSTELREKADRLDRMRGKSDQ